MINSATALQMMAEEIGEPITIDGTMGLGLLRSKVRIWLGRRGFRTDTERSTLNRWINNWVSYGQLIPVSKNGTAYWLAEVTPEKARRVMFEASNAKEGGEMYLYDPNTGQIHDTQKELVDALMNQAGVMI